MRKLARLTLVLFFTSLIQFVPSPAHASCADFPESTTEACIAENLAVEQARQAAYAAKQAADAAAAQAAADAQRAQQAADDAARAKAAEGLPADSCGRPENSGSNKCTQERIAAAQAAAEAAAAQQMAAQSADEIAKRKEWGIYDPTLGDCSQAPNSLTPGCVAQNLVAEKFRTAEYAKAKADASSAATKRAAEAKAAQALAEAKSRAKLLKGTPFAKSDSSTANKKSTAKSTITCVKGKASKVITDTAPKCPSGYKQK